MAPPDRHLLVTKGPHENGYRPAADALFRAAAAQFDFHAIVFFINNLLPDGTAGLNFIKRCGGTAVVQGPENAEFASMPESALRNVAIGYAVPIAEMGALLLRLVGAPASSAAPPLAAAIPPGLKLEAVLAERVVGSAEQAAQLGHQVPLTCPAYSSSLWEMAHGNVLRYCCHTGHAFTAEALAESAQHQLEETLWVALRIMEERKNLLASMASHGAGNGNGRQAERAEELKHHINRLREFLLNGTADPAVPAAG